jgi:hypothetical protein
MVVEFVAMSLEILRKIEKELATAIGKGKFILAQPVP